MHIHIPVSDKSTLILLVLRVGLTPSPLMSMFTDMTHVSASGRINQNSFVLAAAGYICVNFEIRGAGSDLSKQRRHRDECLFIRHRHVCVYVHIYIYIYVYTHIHTCI